MVGFILVVRWVFVTCSRADNALAPTSEAAFAYPLLLLGEDRPSLVRKSKMSAKNITPLIGVAVGDTSV